MRTISLIASRARLFLKIFGSAIKPIALFYLA
jgi:hypothetical protein